MDYIPPSLKFAASKLQFSRSRFRLETQGNTTVNPGQTLTIVMPESAILSLDSFRLHWSNYKPYNKEPAYSV